MQHTLLPKKWKQYNAPISKASRGRRSRSFGAVLNPIYSGGVSRYKPQILDIRVTDYKCNNRFVFL